MGKAGLYLKEVVNNGLSEPYLLLLNSLFTPCLSESQGMFQKITEQKFKSQFKVINPFSII